MKIKLAFILFIVINFTLFSQDYNIEHYNTDNGLPQNSVKDLVKDKYGFLWLTTENGIVRYDGLQFLVFKNFPLNSQRFSFFYGNIERDSILVGAASGSVLLHKRTARVLSNYSNTNIVHKNSSQPISHSSNYSYHHAQGMPFYLMMKKGYYFITESSIAYTDYASHKETQMNVKTVYKKKMTVFATDEVLFNIDYSSKKIYRINNGKVTGRYHMPLVSDQDSRIIWSQLNQSAFIINHHNIYSLHYNTNSFQIKKLANLRGINCEYIILHITTQQLISFIWAAVPMD